MAVAAVLLKDKSGALKRFLILLQESKSYDNEDRHFIPLADLYISDDQHGQQCTEEVRYESRAYTHVSL